VQIPSTYFRSRGFTSSILKRYNVGDCWKRKKKFYARALIPIIDENNNVLGVTGRSVYNWDIKYLHSTGLNTGSILYNYQFAKNHIKDSKTAIIVESPTNVLRLEESKIHNSVALFGVNFSTEKQLLLDQLGVTDLILLFDNDKPDKYGKRAGEEAAKRVIKECSNYYNIKQIKLENVKDVADLKPEEIKGLPWISQNIL
jgi:DNA primase